MAFLLAAENYSEMIGIMEETDEFYEFAGKMKEKFGFSQEQSRYFQHLHIQDFNKKSREEMWQKLDWLKKEKEMYRKIAGR